MATRFTSHRRIEPALVDRRATVTVFVAAGDAVPATLSDISPFGCRLVCVVPPATGTRVTLRFEDGEEASATAMWSEAGIVGCRFDAAIPRTLTRRLSLAIQ